MTAFKETDVAFGKIPFSAMVRKYGPELALAGYFEELTDAPDAPPSPIATAFLRKYLSALPSEDTPSFS